MRRFGGTVDLNASSLGGLDSSMLSMGGGCGDINTTAHLEARKSLSSSQFGRGSFVKPSGAPPSSKKPVFPSGRPSMAHQLGDRCVQAASQAARGQLLFWGAACACGLSLSPQLSHTRAHTHNTHAHMRRRLSAMQGRPTLGGGSAAGGGGSVPAMMKLRVDMPDPRPINSATWKADAAQKVRGSVLCVLCACPRPASRTPPTLPSLPPRSLTF